MGKDARNAVVLTQEARDKFEDCVTALVAVHWPDGPPKDATFAEIEQFGHEVGRMLGCAVDRELTSRHAEGFQEAAACPTCQTLCEPKASPANREIQTSDGRVPIGEPVCHCSVCNRDFFPSAYRFED